MELITTKYFAETVPQNAKYASTTIGAGDDGVVTITADEIGTGGNSYTVAVAVATGANAALAASISGTDITVTLGTTAVAGTADDTKNTATLIAAKITALAGVTAVASGEGTTAISAAVTKKAFTGGQWGTVCPAGGLIFIDDDNATLYFSIASNGKSDANWRSLSLTTP